MPRRKYTREFKESAAKLVSEQDIERLFQSALRLIDVDDSGEGSTETVH